MTRYKELRRLERAIQYKHEEDLKWASGLCERRLSMAIMKLAYPVNAHDRYM